MKKLATIAGVFLLAMAALQFAEPVRRAEAYGYQTFRTLSRGAPAVPTFAVMPAAGDGICASPLNTAGARVSGADVEVTCLAATPCYFRTVASYGAADGGYPTTKGKNNPPGSGDGGYTVLGADNYLAANTSSRFHLPVTDDSVCMGTADGGSLLVSIVTQ